MIPNFSATKKLLSEKSRRWRFGLLLAFVFAALPPARAGDVSLQLLGGKALVLDSGVSFGVPWPEGAVERGSTFNLSAPGGELPVQSWPLAYWPDGSVKWTGFATVVPAGLAGPFTLSASSSAASGALQVTNDGNRSSWIPGCSNAPFPFMGRTSSIR